MELAPAPEITVLLKAWAGGDRSALERLTPLVYDELRRRAARYMANELGGHTLQTTALVNEAYLRLADADSLEWQDRAHFFAVCANVMRHILVDAARARGSEKRGGERVQVELTESIEKLIDRGPELVALDEALEALARKDARKAQVVEMRFFGGLNVDETAEVLRVSRKTVLRDYGKWRAPGCGWR